jgi:hypothetical protein
MNYQKIYDSICQRAKDQLEERSYNRKNKLEYYEGHHIIPKCLGGLGNSKDLNHPNIALLTAREHFICHRLLCEIHPTESKLHYALWKMVHGGDSKQKRIKISGRIYNTIKNEFSKMLSLKMRNRIVSSDTRYKLSLASSGNKNHMYNKSHTDETKLKIKTKVSGSNNGMYGKSHTDETKKLLSEKMQNRIDAGAYENILFSGKSADRKSTRLNSSHAILR